jgi:hypothetical protein
VKSVILYSVLILTLVANFMLCIVAANVSQDSTSATLYGINVLTILLLFSTLAIQSYGVKDDITEHRRKTPYMYSIIGTMVASVAIVSIAFSFDRHFSIHFPLIFFLCILPVAVYVYIIKLRDYP